MPSVAAAPCSVGSRWAGARAAGAALSDRSRQLGCWESQAVLLHGGHRALRAPLLGLAGL